MAKADDAQVQERIEYMADLIVQGKSQAQAVSYVFDTCDWNITKRQLRDYYKRAQVHLANEATAIDRRAALVSQLRRYEHHYNAMRESGDHRGAVVVVDKIVALLNLDSAPALEVNWRDELNQAGAGEDDVRQVVYALLTGGDTVEVQTDE